MPKLIRKSDQVCLVDHLKFADAFFSRLRGLIGMRKFEFGEGLLFPRCNNIHTWMMSIPIDVVFLKVDPQKRGCEWIVSSIHVEVKPWKLLPVTDFHADDVLELPAGLVRSVSLKSGEVLCIA